MDRASSGLGNGPGGSPPVSLDLTATDPLDRPVAIAVLEQGDMLLEADEAASALARYRRVAVQPERDLRAAALFGLGNALYRLDRDGEALSAWEEATTLGETPVTYRAWRQVAAARVRGGDLRGALDAYRQCERRAPREDKPEIASRLGWLSKETGNSRAANRYFARSRGDTAAPFMTYLILAATLILSVAALQPSVAGSQLMGNFRLDAVGVAHGEYWRLFTVTLVHANYLHLFFNLYALWFVGTMVERLYGSPIFTGFWVLGALAGSVASFCFGAGNSVGASGAIFCLFGVALAATRRHHPMLDAQSRSISAQLVGLIVVNLAIGFAGILPIDNFAHLGGLAAGLWLGVLIPPGQVATLATFWQIPGGRRAPGYLLALRVAGVAALVVAIGVGVVVGTQWHEAPSAPGAMTRPAVVAVMDDAPLLRR